MPYIFILGQRFERECGLKPTGTLHTHQCSAAVFPALHIGMAAPATKSARPWYGLDDSGFVKGTEGVLLNNRGQRLVTKAWVPPRADGDATAKEAPFPTGVIVLCHGYVRPGTVPPPAPLMPSLRSLHWNVEMVAGTCVRVRVATVDDAAVMGW